MHLAIVTALLGVLCVVLAAPPAEAAAAMHSAQKEVALSAGVVLTGASRRVIGRRAGRG